MGILETISAGDISEKLKSPSLTPFMPTSTPPAPLAPHPCPTCLTCHSLHAWRDAYDVWHCWYCQPPIVEAMVRETTCGEAEMKDGGRRAEGEVAGGDAGGGEGEAGDTAAFADWIAIVHPDRSIVYVPCGTEQQLKDRRRGPRVESGERFEEWWEAGSCKEVFQEYFRSKKFLADAQAARRAAHVG